MRWGDCFAAGQVDVDASFVVLGVVLETQFATDVFDCGFDFLDVVG